MATQFQKTRALEKAYKITEAYASSGNISLKFATVLEELYRKLAQLEEDADKDD